MQVKLKLYAGLEQYLPEGAEKNTTVVEVEDMSTINAVIRQCNVPADKAHLVLLNGVFINTEQRDITNLFADGDTLAIWPPVAGG